MLIQYFLCRVYCVSMWGLKDVDAYKMSVGFHLHKVYYVNIIFLNIYYLTKLGSFKSFVPQMFCFDIFIANLITPQVLIYELVIYLCC